MYELVHIHMLLNLRKIRESKMNWVPFYQILFGSLYVARKLPTYPSPEPTSTLTSHNRIVTICLFLFVFFLPLFLNTEKARRQSTFSQKGRLTLVPPSQGSLSPSSFFCFLFFFLFSSFLTVFEIGPLFFNQNLWS